MTSRKQEERNEKIIRGLMKLPPNRRCINCNSLGPQYVCTNFQTFVCMTCSGIHREFTHRVKSVSMSKFTSQEVEALQEGGNQRAREIFLKDWDPRQQRLPDSSNADKVREFIKSVYVERKYSGTNTSDKPPRDVQNLRNHEDETRRASSYHSYSQSPPYDYQYEERRYGEGRYGKHAPALTRRSGSDRRNYEGKILSFLSPSRLRDHVHEDRLASEGSSARASDYSTSSGGDPFRSGIQSPTFPRDNSRFSSPSSETSRDILSEDVQQYKVNTSSDLKGKSDADQAPRLQRAALSDSFEAFSSNSVSFKSADSVSEQHAEPPHSVSNFSSLRQSSQPENSDGLELFSRPFVPQSITSTASAIDLFQLADTSSTLSVDFFHPSPPTSMVLASTPQQLQTFPPSSSELFSAIPYQQSAAILTDRSPELSFEKNEGWATFDVPQHVEPSQSNEGSSNVVMHSTDNGSLGNFGQSLNSSFQWSYQDSSANGASSSMHNPWIEGPQYLEGSVHATSNLSWSAFDDSAQHVAFHDIDKQSGGQDAVQIPSIADQYLVWDVSEGSHNNQMGTTFVDSGPSVLIPQSHSFGSANASSALPVMAATHGNGVDQKSNNPFDLPFDFGNESSNTFLDMTSFQAELPDSQIPTSFINGVTNPWFPQGSVVPYVPTRPQGGLGFMAGQASSTQIPNIPSEGPIGRNPFE